MNSEKDALVLSYIENDNDVRKDGLKKNVKYEIIDDIKENKEEWIRKYPKSKQVIENIFNSNGDVWKNVQRLFDNETNGDFSVNNDKIVIIDFAGLGFSDPKDLKSWYNYKWQDYNVNNLGWYERWDLAEYELNDKQKSDIVKLISK